MANVTYPISLPDGRTIPITAPEGAPREMLAQKAMEWYEKDVRREQSRMGAINAIGNGAMLGFHDEATGVMAGIGAALQGKDFTEAYTRETEMVRKAREVFREDSGAVMDLATELGGGLVTSAGISAALNLMLKGSKGIAGFAQGILNNPKTSAAVTGATYGVGEAESPETLENPEGLATATEWIPDAGVKAAIGTAGGLAGHAVVEKLQNQLAPISRQAQLAKEMLLGQRTLEEAGDQLQGMQRIGGEDWARYANVNPQAAQTAASIAQPAKADELVQAVEAQRRKQGPLVEQTIREVTDTPTSRQAEHDALVAARRAEAQQTYAPVMGQPTQPTPEMVATLQTSNGEKAADAALKILNDERVLAGKPLMDSSEAVLRSDFWHVYQQVLRDKAESLANPVNPGYSRLAGGQVGQMRRDLMDNIFGSQKYGQDYQKATELFKERSAVLDAMTDSEKFASMSRGEAAKIFGMLKTPEEERAFRYGVVNDLLDKAMRQGDEGDMTRHLIGNPSMRQKLEMILGPEVFAKLDDSLQKLRTISETNKEVLRGSQTQPRQARTEMLMHPGDIRPPPTNPLDALYRGLTSIQNRGVPHRLGDIMVDASLAQTPEQLRAAMLRLEQMRALGRPIPDLGARLGSRIAIEAD